LEKDSKSKGGTDTALELSVVREELRKGVPNVGKVQYAKFGSTGGEEKHKTSHLVKIYTVADSLMQRERGVG